MTYRACLVGVLAMGLSAVGLVACKTETVESEDIRTSGMYPTFEVLAAGDAKTVASAKLQVGGPDSNTYVTLTGEDALLCTAAGTERILTSSGNGYAATFDGDPGSTAFTFSLARGGEDDNAPNSVVVLPDPFTIAGVTSSDQVSRASALALTWEPGATADPTTWTLDGSCLFETKGTVPDDGTLTLAGSDYSPTPSAVKAASDPTDKSDAICVATLCVERRRAGTLDPIFIKGHGGSIHAVQRRCVDFVSTP